MSIRSLLLVSLLCGAGVLLSIGASAESPNAGVSITEDEVGTLTVFSDGTNLPAGSGTVAEGRAIYERLCLACHGIDGQGGINDQLVGGHVPLGEVPQKRTVGSFWPYAVPLFDYIRRAMPFAEPGTLSDDDVYGLVAYLLHANGIVPVKTTLDAESLREIEMPNRDRFFSTFELPD